MNDKFEKGWRIEQIAITILYRYFGNISIQQNGTFRGYDLLVSYNDGTDLKFGVEVRQDGDYASIVSDLFVRVSKLDYSDRNVRLPIILLLVNEENESAKVGFLVGWRFGRPRIYKNFELRALNQKSADTCLQIIKSMDEVIRVLSTENINVLKRISFNKKLHDNRVQQAEILYLRKLSSTYRMNQKEVVDERERFERLLKRTPEDEYPQDELDNVILEAVKIQYKNAKVSSKLLLLSTDIEDLQHYKDIHCYHTTLLVSPNLSNLPMVALSMLNGLEMFNVGLDIFVENVFYQQAFDGTSFEKEEPLDGWLKKVMVWNRLKSTMSPISSYYR